MKDLVERVHGALDAFDRGPAGAAQTAALVRATREAVVALGEARRNAGESGAARVQTHRFLLHRILEVAAGRNVRASFAESPLATEWMELLVEVIHASHYTVGCLFLARARALGDRTLFLDGLGTTRVSWNQAHDRVVAIGRALLAHGAASSGAPVALVGANSLDLALFDLACLVTGTPNVPVPANAAPAQIGFVLEHCNASALFVGDDAAAQAVLAAFETHRRTAKMYGLSEGVAASGSIRPFREFLESGETVSADAVRDAAFAVKSTDVATTMYTSGTTGDPKGVPFTHANLVTKRFARAAAWSDVGEGDVFLCYLPLYHTFGRWLEMLGCVFWGSVYAFLHDVSIDAMLQAFQRVRPTLFISVPKKWMQIAESVGPLELDPGAETPDPRALDGRLREITGGRLRRGLSAAGYLPASAFRRFHSAGIELHSGFGMTEATGGITMTPSGEYREDSIGVPLPAIELKVAEDRELLIRGPYVTPPAAGDPPRIDGWFATGDIVRVDAQGHLAIVDRKKEIFKNFQGETISPRRIETLFEEFDSVQRVLVIGDRRDYCTALIVPNEEIRRTLASRGPLLESPEVRELFSSIVATVNRFLAPFERILDFALLDRDLDPEAGELTAKGTPKRSVVNERFHDVIEALYSRDHATVAVGNLEVRVPHWFFRQVGLPSDALQSTPDGISLASPDRRLAIERIGDLVRVGDAVYDCGGAELLLGEILGRAELWLGNEDVRSFAGPGIAHWWRRGRRFRTRTRLVSRRPSPVPAEAPPPRTGAIPTHEIDLSSLHAWTGELASGDRARRLAAIEFLRSSTSRDSDLLTLVKDVLASALADAGVRSHALAALLPKVSPAELLAILDARSRDPSFLNPDEVRIVAQQPLRRDHLDALITWARERGRRSARGSGRALRLLVAHAVAHRSSHLAVRSLLVELGDDLSGKERERTEELLGKLVQGMRRRLPMLETEPGVSWNEAIDLDETITDVDSERIRDALRTTPALAEAMALFGPNPADLRPLLRHSLRIRYLGAGTGRTVHLLEWRPSGLASDPPAFECVLKVNQDLEWNEIQTEMRVLVRARTGPSGRPVVKTHGGGYPGPQVWTEEYIPGMSLDVMIDRLASGSDEGDDGIDRLADLWQFIVSSTAALLVDFWTRTRRRLMLANPSPEKIVLPAHDWQTGGRIVSVADRVACDRLLDVLASVRSEIVEPLRTRFPEAELGPEWSILFAAALEIFGEHEGLEQLQRELERTEPSEMEAACRRYVSSVRRRGFMPTRVRIAARRYRRWAQLNPRATLEARATTLDQISDAYGLGELDARRPGSRLQLYRHTVFRGSAEGLSHGLDDVIARTLRGESDRARWHRDVALLKESTTPSDAEEFFLARMLYPHVDPRGRATLVHEEDARGGFEAGIVVEYRDPVGHLFRIRRPASPNEVGALSRIFRTANFRRLPAADRDDLLLVMEDPDRVVGGIIYTHVSETYVRLDWIVVSRHRRGRGVGRALVTEFLERLRAQGVRVVSTGFFRPAFFARFGFGVDPRYAGIVRFLEPEVPGSEAPVAEGRPLERSAAGGTGR